MPKKPHAGSAGPVTPGQPPLDPFGGFKHDDYRYKAMVSQHKKELEIVKTNAWAGVWKVAIPVVVPAAVGAGVLVCAMFLGVPVPWDVALPLLGRAPGH